MGDVLLAAGFLSYFGPFNQDFRLQLQRIWRADLDQRQVPCSADLNVSSLLVDAPTVCV